MKTYQALLIDWDDTIGDFSGAAYRSLYEIYHTYHLERYYDCFEDYYARYTPHNQELWERYGRDEVTKDYLEFDRFFYPLMMATRPPKMDETSQMAIPMCLEHLRHTTDFFSPVPGAIETIRALAERYPISIVSNGFVSVQYTKIERSGLRDCFNHIILSEEVGCQKPNPRIYEEALRRNGIRADQALMIGDSWYSDIYGAAEAGIDTLWIVGDGSKRKEGQHATYEVERIEDCIPLLLN